MRSIELLHDYQKKAVNFQCERPSSMLWLDVGLGKTVITLTSIHHLITCGHLRSVIIVAPVKVIRLVWRQEAKKWRHTSDLSFSLITGSPDQRIRALLKPANIYLINYENIKWLSHVLNTYFIKKNREIPFDGIVWDEVSKMKNSGTQRVRAIRSILQQFKWSTGLTGTPASNGYKDLHGQFLVVDRGERLGTSKKVFETRFYREIPGIHKLIPYDGTEDQIKHLIGDITLNMSAADYNPLPDLIVNDIEIELPVSIRSKYEQLEKDFFFTLDNNKDVNVFNKSALQNKCLQFSNGAVYPVSGLPLWEPVHDLKLEALEDLIEESNGNQLLCAYGYKSDAERIMARFKKLRPINITECKSQASLDNAMERWRKKDCQLMIGHPLSMGHGIDGLQESGHLLVWFGLTWSLDQYDQFNGRLRRQGQGVPVICHRILSMNTFDQVQRLRLNSKDEEQVAIRNAIKEYRKSKGV